MFLYYWACDTIGSNRFSVIPCRLFSGTMEVRKTGKGMPEVDKKYVLPQRHAPDQYKPYYSLFSNASSVQGGFKLTTILITSK